MFKSSEEIRLMFLDFFKSKGHIFFKSSSLIPSKYDDSLLFTNAGMNQFKNIFLGKEKSLYDEIVSVQRCLRISGKHNDLDNVGYTLRHNTFFEMMGNFSFGSYYKEEAIVYAWELLTNKNYFNIPKDKLIITVHISDLDSYNIWNKIINISRKRIFVFGKSNILDNFIFDSDNFWRMSKFGLCGPSTEILYDFGNDKEIIDLYKDKDRYLEIWNIVFIEYVYSRMNKIYSLSKKYVDTGMGLERICMVLQNVKSNFEIDIFKKIMFCLVELFDTKITDLNRYIFYILSDHIRSIIFLILDGVKPSNEFRGYVLRKLIRRSINCIKILQINDFFLFKLVKPLSYIFYFYDFDMDSDLLTFIEKVIYNEELKFLKTLDNSLNLLKYYLVKSIDKKYLSSKIVFLLYDTYGLPLYLISDYCKYYKVMVNLDKFNKRLSVQKRRSRIFSKFNNVNKNNNVFFNIKTRFFGYYNNICVANIVLIVVNNKVVDKVDNSYKNVFLILNNTVFFPESGGQKGDKGYIVKFDNSVKFIVINTMFINKTIVHCGYVEYGILKNNDFVDVFYDVFYRQRLTCNHSAVHLLNSSVKNILNCDVVQKGSCIKSDIISFSFMYEKDLTEEDICNIELLVNNKIKNNLLMFENLKKIPLGFVVDKKYNFNLSGNNYIRIIGFGDFSEEYCCGTHVYSTLDIGFFLIVKFFNVSSGIKCIKAVTYYKDVLYNFIFKSKIINNLGNMLSSSSSNIYGKVLSLVNKKKKLKKKTNELKSLYINSILNFINNNDIFVLKKTKILVKELYLLNVDKEIIFVLFNRMKNIYNLSLIIITVVSNNKRYFWFFLNKENININLDLLINEIIGFFYGILKLDNNFYFRYKDYFVSFFLILNKNNNIKDFINKLLQFIKNYLSNIYF